MKQNGLSALGKRTQEPPISWLMKMALSHPKLISLAAGFTDSESLPVQQTRDLLDEVLSSPKTGRPALQYGSTAGDPHLRQLTSEHLRNLDAKISGQAPIEHYTPERMLITHGSQQLLYMVTEALCDPGDIVLVEDPTYFVFLGIMQSHGLFGRGVRMLKDGIDLAHLEQRLIEMQESGELRRFKFLYLVSYFQNPTGTTTSYENKVGALRLLQRFERAAGHPIYLLEDAAYRELRFTGEDISSALCAPNAAKRVIYTSTYSKPFATGVRVGFGILPPELYFKVRCIKGNHDFGTTNLLQALLVRALSTGIYVKHLQDLRARYAQKAEVMANALRHHFPETVQLEQPRGGLYIWARLRNAIKSGIKSRLFKAALKGDVLYVPGELCYCADPARRKPNHEMRLSFGGAAENDIRTGISRLGQTVRQF